MVALANLIPKTLNVRGFNSYSTLQLSFSADQSRRGVGQAHRARQPVISEHILVCGPHFIHLSIGYFYSFISILLLLEPCQSASDGSLKIAVLSENEQTARKTVGFLIFFGEV
ncbi:hypothetical protein D6O72_24645 [Salmonella enterica]|nr:hypothetical protein [Salmonella enterica]